MFPDESAATACGLLNRAEAAAPLSLPMPPGQPASVVTSAVDVILRMVKLLESAMNTLLPSLPTPDGVLNRAAFPVPSADPPVPAVPATVVTTPPLVILRIVWLFWSATNTLPRLSTATPLGLENCAAPPVPSALPRLPP